MTHGEVMTFQETVEEFMETYKMVDTEHVYSNGTEYVPIFRMKQWFRHVETVPVIRCKDCKHWDCDDGESYCDELGIFNTDMNSYCSYAKRKEE